MYSANIENGIVKQVIVGNSTWAIENLGGTWVDTEVLVGIGWTWNEIEGFRSLQPYPSWTWNSETYRWKAPVPYPNNDGIDYVWNEETQEWDVIDTL
jgi:hypothetical protein